MEEEPTVTGRRNRSRGGEAAVRSAALERLKALRSSGGRRCNAGGPQVKVEAPIYDTLAEEDYEALVARRREEASSFIVDDDGLGYTDEGQEEDWSNPNLPYSSGDEEPLVGDVERSKKRKAPKKDAAPKKPPPSSLTAAAAMMGKQRLSYVFTSSVFKKKDRMKGSSHSSDSIVDDVIAEFAPDETDREERRRRGLANQFLGLPSTGLLTPPVVQIKSELRQPLVLNERYVDHGKQNSEEAFAQPEGLHENGGIGDASNQDKEAQEEDLDNTVKPACKRDSVEVNADASKVKTEETKSDKRLALNAKIKVQNDASALSATASWRAVCGGEGHAEPEVESTESKGNLDSDDKFEFTVDTDGSLPFYMIDAHEETFGSNSGTLYLFGKVKAGNAYHSCCVVVKNMQRCVYAVPKVSIFDKKALDGRDTSDSQNAEATFQATLQEMASGMKHEIAKYLLDLNVSSFSMMPVKRNYAFERSDIPSGEQYVLKVNYPFKDPPLPAGLIGEHFLALFGTHSRIAFSVIFHNIAKAILDALATTYGSKNNATWVYEFYEDIHKFQTKWCTHVHYYTTLKVKWDETF